MLGRLAQTYYTRCLEILDDIYHQEQQSMHNAAVIMSDALIEGRRIHLWDTGHTIGRELVNRAGGMMDITPLEFDLELTNEIAYEPVVKRNVNPSEEAIRGFVAYALAHSHISSGDVLIIGSVSGARPIVMEVALQAKDMGVTVIGLTSLTYSKYVSVKHSSGKKLYEVCDLVINNDCEVGDSVVPVPELEGKVGPTTGITAAMIMWLVVAEVVEILLSKGHPPKMFISMNLPGAMERNERVVQELKSKEVNS